MRSILSGRNWLRQSFIQPRIEVKNLCMNAIEACFCRWELGSFKKHGRQMKWNRPWNRCFAFKSKGPCFSPLSFSLPFFPVIEFYRLFLFPFVPHDTSRHWVPQLMKNIFSLIYVAGFKILLFKSLYCKDNNSTLRWCEYIFPIPFKFP